MSGPFIAWLILLGLIAVVWLTRHAAISSARRREPVLSSRSYDGPPEQAPRISVLVAAKDEQENIESCVTTFCEQDYPDFEVIVIDDRSSDETPAILQRLHKRYNDRLRVLTVRRLRHGWFGKNNAMREGVSAATGQWLCFADADCRQTSPSTLSMAMREAQAGRDDFLSVLPVLETKTFWERLIQPVCAAIMVFWFRPERVNDPRSPAAYANGAFMLIKRRVYDAIGGHERVKTEVNEDMHLARITKQMGHHLRVIQNDDLYVTRMYATLGQTWRGWSRIFYGCLASFRRLLVAMSVLTAFSLVPWASLLISLIGWAGAGPETVTAWRWLAVFSVVTVLLEQSVMFRFYRLARGEPRWSLAYLLAACICWGMLASAMLKRLGATSTTWRGTTYHKDQLQPEAPDAPANRAPDAPAEELGAHAP
ncbi:MAG TPA: glycosyltransferase family 2 protein [Phycisphaerae bacterium]|nr:glycosyltransferase family 2 protein [Phycisphaerae bacterium]